MKKNLLIAAIAITALASCSSNDFVGDESPQTSSGTVGAISFNMGTQAITRGTSEDATKLNNQFIVWGEKNEDQSAAGAAPTDGNLVFKNYLVKYTENTANQTTSNTNNWEYVGISATSNENTNISPNSGTGAQTIKYWDNAADSYTFTAISARPEDIEEGRVRITKTQTGGNVYGKGYTVTLAKDGSSNYPSLTDLYFADRINIAKGSGYSHNAVQFTFRNVLSHVRVGMYETIPGYEVSEIKFYKADGTTEYNNGASTPVSAFGAVCPNVSATNFEGTITTTYYDATKTEIQNHPKLTVTPSSGIGNSDLVLGTNFSTLTAGSSAKFMGTTASAPTYDTDGGTYTAVLPQINNTTPLQLKVNYKLYNTVTKEIIQITGKTAVIPAEYLQWKANFKYTYLFKITDEELNPITFDAVVVETENGEAEYITTLSAPSITTLGVNSSTGKYVTGGSEYAAGSDIYASFVEGTAVKTPTLGTSGAQHVNIYAISTPNATSFPITEASVAEAIANPASASVDVYTRSGTEGSYTYTKVTDVTTLTSGTTYYKADAESKTPDDDGYTPTVAVAGTHYTPAPKLTVVNINSDESTYFTAVPSVVTTVPSEDGNTVTIDAVKLTGVKATTGTTAIAIEYQASAAWTGTYNKVYKVIKVQ